MAHGGTLYLSGIDELDPSAQAALAKLLEVRALGTTPVDIGIACGTERLREALADGRLRDDLFRQLEPAHVKLPPLRNRRVDLARLVQREVAEVAAQTGQTIGPHPRLLEACLLRPWPANVTELRAAIRGAAMRAIGDRRDQVKDDDLAADAGLPEGAAAAETAVERKTQTGDLDKASLEATLARANGVLTVAARMLGMHRSQLIKLLDEHGIAHDE
jgi:DNA-binding NtrC family response regulator